MSAAAVNPSAAPALQYGEPMIPQRDLPGHHPIPEAIARIPNSELNANAKIAAMALAYAAGANGKCYLSPKKFGERFGMERRTAERAYEDLAAYSKEELGYGLIRRDDRRSPTGVKMASWIEFLWHPIYERAKVTEMPGRKAKTRRKGCVKSDGDSASDLTERKINTPPSSSYGKEKEFVREQFGSEKSHAREPEPEPKTDNLSDLNDDDKKQNAEPNMAKRPDLGDSAEAELFRLVEEVTGKTPDPKLVLDITKNVMQNGGTVREFVPDARERAKRLSQFRKPSPGVFLTLAANYGRDVGAEIATNQRRARLDGMRLATMQAPRANIPDTPGCGCTGGVRIVGGVVSECKCEVAAQFRRSRAERMADDARRAQEEAAKAAAVQ